MNSKYGMIYRGDFKIRVTNIATDATTFKKAIFKSVVMNTELDANVPKVFMAAINDFLRFWDEYSKDLAPKMRKTKGTAGIRTMDTAFAKDFVYSKFDYAAVLPFADGVVKGITDGKFTKVEDIEDFRDHTISKAFDDMPTSVGGLLDKVLNPDMGIEFDQSVSEMDAKMFDQIKTYNMFDTRSRTELYKAIDKTIEFITIDLRNRHYPQNRDMRLFVSMINNIIDFITYSVTAYATRIFVISSYAYPFIYADKSSNIIHAKAVSESYTEAADGDATDRNLELSVMRGLEENIIKDPADIGKFIEKLEEFAKLSGMAGIYKDETLKYTKYYHPGENFTGNLFVKDIVDNQIINFLTNRYNTIPYSGNARDIEELHHIVRSMLVNPTKGLQGTSSPRNEILHSIRGTKNGDTVQDIQLLGHDLVVFAMGILIPISNNIDEINQWKSDVRPNVPNRMNLDTQNKCIEIMKMLNDLYREIAFAVLERARDIEERMNVARNASIEKTSNMLSIKIPGADKDPSNSDSLSSSVPSTTRMPIELTDLYELPVFESLQAIDECIRYLPEFADDMYFSEAFNISQLINALIAKIRGGWKKIETFFTDQKFQQAVKWVTDHKNDLMTMDLRGCDMEVIPYKVDVSLPEGFENLLKGLQNVPDKALESQQEMEKWIKSLYPSETVYKWFTEDPKTGAVRYRNLFLFQNANEVDDKRHDTPVKIKDTDVARDLKEWIKTIETSNNLYQQLKKLQQDIDTALNRVKARTVGAAQKAGAPTGNTQGATQSQTTTSNTQTQAGGTTSTTTEGQKKEEAPLTAGSAGGTGTSNNSATSGAAKPNNGESIQQGGDVISTAITKATVAVDQLYESLRPMIIEYLRAEYKYLQTAYAYSKKKNSQ